MHPKSAQRQLLNTSLGEQVVYIPLIIGSDSVSLQTTVYYPQERTKRPLVVINHGADGRLPSYHDQERSRPEVLANFFLKRGYIVAAPMREGFAGSTGSCNFRCDHATYALTYARDIEATINYFTGRGEADSGQILVIGQSNGGIVTLGYAASKPIAKAIINLAGGIDTYGDWCDWQQEMMKAASTLGAKTSIPSLWIYAKDDPIFPPAISKPFFERYYKECPQAQMILFSAGGHGFAFQSKLQQYWEPSVIKFLEATGLP